MGRSKKLKVRAQDSSRVHIFAPSTIPGIISHARIRRPGPARCHAPLIPLTLTSTCALTPTRIPHTSLPARPCSALPHSAARTPCRHPHYLSTAPAMPPGPRARSIHTRDASRPDPDSDQPHFTTGLALLGLTSLRLAQLVRSRPNPNPTITSWT